MAPKKKRRIISKVVDEEDEFSPAAASAPVADTGISVTVAVASESTSSAPVDADSSVSASAPVADTSSAPVAADSSVSASAPVASVPAAASDDESLIQAVDAAEAASTAPQPRAVEGPFSPRAIEQRRLAALRRQQVNSPPAAAQQCRCSMSARCAACGMFGARVIKLIACTACHSLRSMQVRARVCVCYCPPCHLCSGQTRTHRMLLCLQCSHSVCYVIETQQRGPVHCHRALY